MQLGPLQQAWVDALRSGKYKQGLKRLRDGEKHCCLGVLCELAVEAGITKRSEHRNGVFGYGHCDVTNYPPVEVTDWIGLKSSSGVLPGATNSSLVDRNDHGCSFEQIASLIEEKADLLFKGPM